MSADETFGRQLLAAETVDLRLELERAATAREPFAELDATIERLVLGAMQGERVIELGQRYDDETITLLAEVDDELVQATYDVDVMETRGAWAVPERETVSPGWINFAWWVGQEPRFVGSLANDEQRKVTLRGNSRAVLVWAALAPIFDLLVIPHELRSAKAGKADVDAQAKQWAKLDSLVAATGLDLADELAVFRPNSGWSRLSSTQMSAARETLVAAWARNATPEVAGRLRMWMVSQLVERFYSKAKKATPTARQVLIKAAWRPLIGLFGGDWLAFLRYLGEAPASNEEIITSLPDPKIYVGAEDRARAAAAAAGVDEVEVERMLSSFFGGQQPTSPVERRVGTLKRVWRAVDELHATQVAGGQCLWGVLDEQNEPADNPWHGYTQGLWRDLFPDDLNAEIKELWGTQSIGKAPGRLITRALPHAGAMEALGPALHFWHYMSSSAFANTEAMSQQHSALIDANRVWDSVLKDLDAMGHGVDRKFFDELNEAADKLADIKPRRRPSSVDVGHGLSIEITVSVSGVRVKRKGFERVRDVIARHRRGWAAEHLDGYLRDWWQGNLRAAAEAYNRAVSAKGKPPTVRQTITASKPVVDRWFGGDVGAMLAAIGQKGPSESPVYERVLPEDVYALTGVVAKHLGLVEEPPYREGIHENKAEFNAWRAAKDHNRNVGYAAAKAFGYIAAWESLGYPPELKNVPGLFATEWMADGDREKGWDMLREAVSNALAEMPETGYITPVEMTPLYDAMAGRDEDPEEGDDEPSASVVPRSTQATAHRGPGSSSGR